MISNPNFDFRLDATAGIPLLNQESREGFGQGKPKPQELGRASLRQFAVNWVCPVRKSDPLCFLMFSKGLPAAAPRSDIQNENC